MPRALQTTQVYTDVAAGAVRLAPASAFGIGRLTEAYNQTRVDYLIPMPMNAERLAEYIRVNDVDLDQSIVALDGDAILGLGMLGVRPGRMWITRLGVLPARRRRGIGQAIVHQLIDNARRLGIENGILEVIHNNLPAHRLFVKCGYAPRRLLLVMRRPPSLPVDAPTQAPRNVRWLSAAEAVASVAALPSGAPWINAPASLRNAEDAAGIALELRDGGRGWLVFRLQRYILSHLVFRTESGDPIDVAHALLAELHTTHPRLDTYAENLAVDDPHMPALFKMGYIESFRRIEMALERPDGDVRLAPPPGWPLPPARTARP